MTPLTGWALDSILRREQPAASAWAVRNISASYENYAQRRWAVLLVADAFNPDEVAGSSQLTSGIQANSSSERGRAARIKMIQASCPDLSST